MSITFGSRFVQTRIAAVLMVAFLIIANYANGQSDPSYEPEKGTIESGKFQLDYMIEGTGSAAIVIGFPNYYSRIFSQNLRSQLRMVFVDHRGSAPSPGQRRRF